MQRQLRAAPEYHLNPDWTLWLGLAYLDRHRMVPIAIDADTTARSEVIVQTAELDLGADWRFAEGWQLGGELGVRTCTPSSPSVTVSDPEGPSFCVYFASASSASSARPMPAPATPII